MASRRKRRQPAALRRYWASRRGRKSSPRRRRRAKRNFASAGMLANPRRRRRHSRRRSSLANRRSYRRHVRRHTGRRRSFARRNPSLFGFQLPDLSTVLFVGAGYVLPPIVTNYLMAMIPDQYKTNRAVYWAVKGVSVLGPSLLVKKFVNQRAGNLLLLGGVVGFALDLVKEFAPGVIPGLGAQPFLGYYERPQRNLNGMGKYLGAVSSRSGFTPIMDGTPERLLPQGRF